jgi:hypothetical protein
VLKTTGVLLLIAGLVMGPGYYVYSRYYTGREITVKPLEFQQQKDGSAHAVAVTDLLPVMGPITFIVNFTASYDPSINPGVALRNTYHARVSFDDHTLLERSFTLMAAHQESNPAELFKQALPTIVVHTPGKYTLELVQDKDAGMQIRQAWMQVKVGVEHFNRNIFISGIVMLVLGIVVLVIAF